MTKNISKEQLLEAIEKDLSAYEMSIELKSCPKTIYNKLKFFELTSVYESKKEQHHALIKDLGRFVGYKLLCNLAKIVTKKTNNRLKPAEIAFIQNILKSDGLIESISQDDDSQIGELKGFLQNKRNELDIKDENKTNEQIEQEHKDFLSENEEEEIIDSENET